VPGDYATIQEAMDAADPGDTVFVAPGAYTDANEFEIFPGASFEAVVILRPGVTLWGRPDAPESVVIQAADTTLGIYCQDVDSTAVVVGFTVTGGRTGFGGTHASPTIRHCRFVANRSSVRYNSGGGMYGDFFSPTVSDCVFADNLAESGGGATFANESFPVLRGCLFTGNEALPDGNLHAHGGGLTITQHSGAVLVDCAITGNSAESDGGGIWLSESTVRLENVVASGNVSGRLGGAFYVQHATTLELIGGTVTDNAAATGGGGLYVRFGGVITATGCSWRDNSAPAGADGYLAADPPAPLVTLICCDIAPEQWEGGELVIDDTDCD
jgi:hypothetical protein